MVRPRRHRAGALLLGAACALALATGLALGSPVHLARAGSMVFRPCSPGSRIQCGRVTVPLDRSGRFPGRVRLFVMKVKTAGPARGTLVALTGGPGESASTEFSSFLDELLPVLRGRELVIFDQRGTGRSGRLACPSLRLIAARPEKQVAACARRLGPRAAFYSTEDSVGDLEAVRRAVRARAISIYAVSYGTLLAEEYAARYPRHVSHLIIDSSVPPGPVDPFNLSMFEAVPRLVDDVCRAGCAKGLTRDPVGDLAALVARLHRHRLFGYLVSRHGRRQRKALNASQVMNVLLAGDLVPPMRAAFPAAVLAALHGDAGPMLRMVYLADHEASAQSPGDSNAVYVATSCEDARLPWGASQSRASRRASARTALAAVAPSDYVPFDLETLTYESDVPLCLDWPSAGHPPATPTSIPASVPTLDLSGSNDIRTPPQDAVRIVHGLRHARLLIVPDVGHDVMDSTQTHCPLDAFRAFLAGRSFRACGPERVDTLAPVAPTALSQVSPRALDGRLGRQSNARVRAERLLGAVALTVRDLVRQVGQLTNAVMPLVGGGLRAGSFAQIGRDVLLSGYSYIPGVALSGSVDAHGDGTLRVGDRGVGVLALGGWRLQGRLDGFRVDLRLPDPAPRAGRRIAPRPLPVPGCSAERHVCRM